MSLCPMASCGHQNSFVFSPYMTPLHAMFSWAPFISQGCWLLSHWSHCMQTVQANCDTVGCTHSHSTAVREEFNLLWFPSPKCHYVQILQGLDIPATCTSRFLLGSTFLFSVKQQQTWRLQSKNAALQWHQVFHRVHVSQSWWFRKHWWW